jgi:GH43 family beta-xylosidase
MRRALLSAFVLALCCAPATARAVQTAPASTPAAPGADGSSFRNPVLPQTASGDDSPDPWIFRHGGRYWLTYTTTDHIEVRNAATLAGLADAAPKRLWPAAGASEPADRATQLWAPEIHRLTGPNGPRWYLYYAATGADTSVHRMYVLESVRDDPAGPYRFKGQLQLPDPFAIDGSVFTAGGRTYLLYSAGATVAPTSIAIAELSDPWTVRGTPLTISRPTLPWETVALPINEGPEALVHDGRLHVVYSASWCGTGAYALGRLTVPVGADLLDPATWEGAKALAPMFSAAPARGVFGPGHGSFFTSPDGRESWMVYHATEDDRGCFTGGLRTTRAQRFTWNADGTPNLGTPVSLATDVAAPGGDGTIARQAERALRRPAGAARGTLVADRRLVGYQGLAVRPVGARRELGTVRVRVVRGGRWTVHLRLLGGPRVGTVTLANPAGGRAVTRSARRAAAAAVELELGTVTLRRGLNALRLRAAGPVVLDQLRLERVR